MNYCKKILSGMLFFSVCFITLLAVRAGAEQDPWEEHLSHHPELQQGGEANSTKIAGTGKPGASVPGAGGGMMGGAMMEQMGEMMKQMNLPKPKELYPSLMEIPELSRAERIELEQRAHARMKEATAMFSEALESLSKEAMGDDFLAMQASTKKLKDATSRFESALATHRALTEGKSPKNVALKWFKREMKISDQAESTYNNVSKYSWFHLSAMGLLILFGAVMIVMYFFKMRRASLLLQQLVSNGASIKPQPSSSMMSKEVIAQNTFKTNSIEKKWSGKLKVSRIFEETKDVKTFRLMNPLGGMLPFSFLPGQFLSVNVTSEGRPVKRGYTIASSPTQADYVEITVKHKEGGVVSDILHHKIKVGDILEFSGPSGTFTFTGQECKCILLVGAGVGITPLMSVLRYLTDRCWSGDIYLVYGCKTPSDIIYKEELDYLQHRHSNLKVIVTVSRPDGTNWSGETGRIDRELFEKSVPNITSRYVHICGPVPMMETVKLTLGDLGIPKDRIHTEAFGSALGKPEPVEAVIEGVDSDTPVSTVRFCLSDKTAPLPTDSTILEVADAIGVEIDNSCRSGICGLCKIKLVNGKVTMAEDESLTEKDKESGLILACQAKSKGDVEVDA